MAGFSIVLMSLPILFLGLMAVIVFIATALIGIAALIFGIVRLIRAGAKQKQGALLEKGYRSAGVVLTVMGGVLITVICGLCLFGTIWIGNPPTNAIDTGISIEEKGFQAKQFTANGIAYTVMDVEPNVDYCDENSTPSYTYQVTEESSTRFGNYCRIESDGGFDLLYANALLFCPDGQQEVILDYYCTPKASQLKAVGDTTQDIVSPSVYEGVRTTLTLKKTNLQYLSASTLDSFQAMQFTLSTNDQLFEVEVNLLFTEDTVYLIGSSFDPDWDSDATSFFVLPLEDDIATKFDSVNPF